MSRFRTLINLFVLPVIAFAILPAQAAAQVPSGPLSIHVEAVLEEPTSVGAHTVSPFNGTAMLTSRLVEGESEIVGTVPVLPQSSFDMPGWKGHLSGGPLTQRVEIVCSGTVDDDGNGSGRCASSGEFAGAGTWAGRIDVETRSLILDIYLQVVCQRCAPR